ncbi:hypothetical protein [uncultured Formosa sp.]|uniref:hypothetical protein n=1 Tax=uncultured Formosa sp. TaxID=255435 RepID=UPI00261D2D37|nr:hypothetical protein [uncultured Formosa sp.]
MKILLLTLTILLSICANSQTEKSELYLTKESDTTFWKNIQAEKIKEFKLPELNFQSEFVFRTWNPGSMLEITKNNDSISGKIIYFVFEVWENDSEADTFVKTYFLPKSISENLYEYILNSRIKKIPSDKYIKDWQQGFDGITHIYELKENNTYSFKNFWTPKAQKGITEAEFIIDFNKKISEIGELEKYGKDFIEKIPFISYKYSGSAYSIINPITKKELRKYKRERKKKQRNKNKR